MEEGGGKIGQPKKIGKQEDERKEINKESREKELRLAKREGMRWRKEG